MSLRPQDLQALVAAFDASDWDELTLTVGGETVQLSTSGRPPAAVQAAASGAPSEPAVAEVPAPPSGFDVPGGRAGDPATPAPAAGREVLPASRLPSDGGTTHAITSPTVGVLWRSPEPGAPPFVEVGQRVGPTDPVCIVEVMKLFNHVQAGVAGTIRSVQVDDAAMVEHGQTLFLVELEP